LLAAERCVQLALGSGAPDATDAARCYKIRQQEEAIYNVVPSAASYPGWVLAAIPCPLPTPLPRLLLGPAVQELLPCESVLSRAPATR